MMQLNLEEVRSLDAFEKIKTESWSDVSPHIRLRLINSKRVEDGVPYRSILDLSYVLSVQERTRLYVRSYILTQEDLDRYGVEFNEAYDIAERNMNADNTKRIILLKEKLMSLNNPFSALATPPPKGSYMQMSNQNQMAILNDEDEEHQNIITVVSSKGPLGASYAMLSSTIREVKERFNNESFYMLPLSTNEMMFIRDEYVTQNGSKPRAYVEDDLLDMIEIFNNSKDTATNNILSYKAYFYDANDGNRMIMVKR